MSAKEWEQFGNTLKKIKSSWPKPMPVKAKQLFQKAQKELILLKKSAAAKSKTQKQAITKAKLGNKSILPVITPGIFDLVPLFHQVLKSHDLLFLSRQITYHFSASNELPTVFGLGQEATAIFSEIISLAAKQADFATRMEIVLKSIEMRDGLGVEVKIIFEKKELLESDRQNVVEQFYGRQGTASTFAQLGVARANLRRVGGQLWLEFPSQDHMAVTFSWPSFDISKVQKRSQYGAYKLDIVVNDFAKLRQRFGVERMQKVVAFVEEIVKSQVRHPLDVVLSVKTEGLVTTIYEAQSNAASSVSNRISQRLKKEVFRLGSRTVQLKFRYQLSFLS